MDRADVVARLQAASVDLAQAERDVATAKRVEVRAKAELSERIAPTVTSVTALSAEVDRQAIVQIDAVLEAQGRLYHARVRVEWWQFVVEHDLVEDAEGFPDGF